MCVNEQRELFRGVLMGTQCLSPASVYDPLSARIAEAVGYKIGMLSGSIASKSTLAAPDANVLTLTEFADQIRRITRVSKLSLMVDADHGFGNALNVMRTVAEFAHAGVSALTIEDTALPMRFGQPAGTVELISLGEMVGKLRAAVQARGDSSVIVCGRTAVFKGDSTEHLAARAKAYATTGIDALFISGLKTLEDLDAIRATTTIPLLVGAAPHLRREDLAERGVRILLQGHDAIAAAVRALHDTYTHLYRGGSPAGLKPNIASDEEMASLIDEEQYNKWEDSFLR